MIHTTVRILSEANKPPCDGEQSPLAHLLLVPWTPPRMAWEIDEWLEEIETHTRRFAKLTSAARKEIVERLGTNGVIKPDDPNYPQAVEEMQKKETELGEVEVTLEKARLIHLDQLPDAAKLTGYDVRVLKKFLLAE